MTTTTASSPGGLRATRLFAALVWGALVIAGAAFLRFGDPVRWFPVLVELNRYESVHIVAHVFLYGTLTLLTRPLSRRPWFPVAVVFVIGLVQEAAQTVFGKGMGLPELFDLAVDVAAAVLVVWIARRRERTRNAVS